MQTLFFHDYLTAKDCADKYNVQVVQESLESVGLDNRPPCYIVDLSDEDAEDWEARN